MSKTMAKVRKWTKADFLFWFIGAWAIIQFAMCLIEFLGLKGFQVPQEMPFSYFLLLLIYVLRKEVDRWLKKARKRRKGEFFLIGWWLAMLIMFGIEFKSHGRYRVPPRMVETCFLILMPYLGAGLSKILHAHARHIRENRVRYVPLKAISRKVR